MLALTALSFDTKTLDLARCLEEFGVPTKTWGWMNVAERAAFLAARAAAPALAEDN